MDTVRTYAPGGWVPVKETLWPGIPDHPAHKPESVRKSVLDEANRIVNGERANVYGGPEDSFKTIAGLWSAYTNHSFSPSDVAIMLGLLKIARLKQSPDHRDSWVDLAGYAACGAECGIKK